MYTTLFLVQALLQGLLLAWLVRIRRRTGAAAAAVLLLPQLGLVYDNLVVALGSFIGLGPLLEALSWPRFWTHWFCGSWLIIACGSILRLAGFDWAQRRWVMGAFCLLTAALMLHDLPEFWSNRLYPVCQFDLVRYSTSVGADKFCLPDQVVVKGGAPLAAIVTSFVVIGTGIVLLARRAFPWMLAGAVLMLLSAAPPAMAYKLDNLGEVLIAGGCIWAIARFARGRARAAGAA